MIRLTHYCSDCDSKFSINYNPEDCEDSPHYCPFCSSYILENESEQDEDY